MTRKHFHILLAVVVVLILTVVVVENTDDAIPDALGQRLLPEFSDKANDARRVRIVVTDSDPIVIRRDNDRWIMSSRNDYPADIGKLRQLMVALAEARIIEVKTANPEHYGRLGVDDPESGGTGTGVFVEGDGFSYSVVLGNVARGNYRYARLASGETSYLIDKNPTVAKDAGDWLLSDIVDVPSSRIRRVSVEHADGENIVVEKTTRELTDFAVIDVPGGRELSYATVGNGIAGALGALQLDDVRKAVDAPAGTSVVFDTWDGLRITAAASADGDVYWITFSAQQLPIESDGDSPENGGEDAASTGQYESANAVNDRVAGWQYRLPDYKKNLLIRRWDDILKPEDATDE